jgi:streptomycin 3"-adenylyltransferase
MEANRKVIGFTKDVTRRLTRVLDDALIGVYVHGSCSMDAFVYPTSDIDMLAVSTRELTDVERRQVGEVLLDPGMPCPGSGLEFSLVTDDSLNIPSKSPAFEVHVCTVPERRKFVDGRGHPGDPDLVLHYAMCHDRGYATVGPAPREVFPVVPRSWVLEAMLDQVAWDYINSDNATTILNACRAVQYAETGQLTSKFEGGHWAIEHRHRPMLVQYALRVHRNKPKMVPTAEHAKWFVDWANERLNAALDEEEDQE